MESTCTIMMLWGSLGSVMAGCYKLMSHALPRHRAHRHSPPPSPLPCAAARATPYVDMLFEDSARHYNVNSMQCPHQNKQSWFIGMFLELGGFECLAMFQKADGC